MAGRIGNFLRRRGVAFKRLFSGRVEEKTQQRVTHAKAVVGREDLLQPRVFDELKRAIFPSADVGRYEDVRTGAESGTLRVSQALEIGGKIFWKDPYSRKVFLVERPRGERTHATNEWPVENRVAEVDMETGKLKYLYESGH